MELQVVSRIGVAGVAALLVSLMSATPVSAINKDEAGAEATPSDGGADLAAWENLGEDGFPTSSSGGNVTCEFVEAGPELVPGGHAGFDGDLDSFETTTELVEDSWYFVACTGDGQTGPWRFFQYTPGDAPVVDPISLAHRARDSLELAFPDPRTSPPADFQQLVGLRTWLWIDANGYQPITATASIPGLTVTATATPTQVTWNMGDDTDPITCTDAGTPYDLDRPSDQQSTDCSHVYQWAGDYTATATVTWAITWSATNGAGGTLPSIPRTTSFDLDVIERQAVVVDNP